MIFAAYFPVINSSHLKLLKEKDFEFISVLDREFLIREFPEFHLERDLRACDSFSIKVMLEGLGFHSQICANENDLEELQKIGSEKGGLTLPLEDISLAMKEKFFRDIQVIFEKTFLRWERNAVLESSRMPEVRMAGIEEIPVEIIRIAEEEGKKSSDWWRQVGACAFRDGEAIMWARNEHRPTEYSPFIDGDSRACLNAGQRTDLCGAIHAEASIIASAARQGISLEGMSMFVTTFPCPTCARLIAAAGIKRVFFKEGYSLLDAKEILELAGIDLARI
ncbi:MAG: deaminase [Candidatus Paceibacterota bacterium]